MARRIDDSHQPFKRLKKIGPGPKKHPPVLQVREWECQRGPKKKGFYTQICKFVGDGERAPRTVRLKKAKKKKYNKLYRQWARRNRAKLAGKAAQGNYKCRRTASTKCR